MIIKPLADKVLLEQFEAEETTASGLFIAASAQEKPEVMKVVAVGPGTEEDPMTVKEGDKVITAKYSGTSVKVDGTEYTIASVKDILAVVE
jgi:chaperonin GroES